MNNNSTIYQLASALQSSLAEHHQLTMMRNVLVKTGYKREAEELQQRMVEKVAIADAVEEKCEELQADNRLRLFSMYFAMDLAYSEAINVEEIADKLDYLSVELLQNVVDQRCSLQNSIKGIDEYGINGLSQEYCDATCELDDLYAERIAPQLEVLLLNANVGESYEYDDKPHRLRLHLLQLLFLLRYAKVKIEEWQIEWNRLLLDGAHLYEDFTRALECIEQSMHNEQAYGVRKLPELLDPTEISGLYAVMNEGIAKIYGRYAEKLRSAYENHEIRKNERNKHRRKRIARRSAILSEILK